VGKQTNGTCLLRTKDLLDPTSWCGWNGASFSVSFADPYTLPPGADVSPHICSVLEDQPQGLPRAYPPKTVCCQGKPMVTQGLVWSSFLRKFIAVLWNTGHLASVGGGAPFVFATSDDLLAWSAVAPLPLPDNLPAGNLAYPRYVLTCSLFLLDDFGWELSNCSERTAYSTQRRRLKVRARPLMWWGGHLRSILGWVIPAVRA
jgi:hypothetical protein